MRTVWALSTLSIPTNIIAGNADWDRYSVDPVLQDQRWQDYTVEQLFGQDEFDQNLGQDQDKENFNLEISHAQHQIEQLLVGDVHSHPTSNSPESINNDEQICIGMVMVTLYASIRN